MQNARMPHAERNGMFVYAQRSWFRLKSHLFKSAAISRVTRRQVVKQTHSHTHSRRTGSTRFALPLNGKMPNTNYYYYCGTSCIAPSGNRGNRKGRFKVEFDYDNVISFDTFIQRENCIVNITLRHVPWRRLNVMCKSVETIHTATAATADVKCG